MKHATKRKAPVRAGRASVSAAVKSLTGNGTAPEVVRSAALLHLVPRESKMGQDIRQEASNPWSMEQLEAKYQNFVANFKSAYGEVIAIARAIVRGEVTDTQIRDLWASHSKEDTARKFLAALKEGLRSAQADEKGNLPADAFTYNVNPKTKVLSRQTIQKRDKKSSLLLIAKKLARIVKKEEFDDAKKQKAIVMFTAAINDPEQFLAQFE